MTATDWITSVASAAAVLVALGGVYVAYGQLKRLNETLRTNSLMAVLAIESDLGERKEKIDELTRQIAINSSRSSVDSKELQAYQTALDAAIENWLNSLERVCFCINKGYIPEKDWRAEYRGYVADAIQNNGALYGAGTRYKNTIDVHEKWAGE